MIGSTAVKYHTNIFRFALMEYSKMMKIPSRSFCLCSWFKRLSISFGMSLAMKSMFCCLRAGFSIRSLQRDFKRVDCTVSIVWKFYIVSEW